MPYLFIKLAIDDVSPLGIAFARVAIDVAGKPRELLGALAVLVATGGYACGAFVIKRRLGGVPPLGPVAAALAIATLMLAPFAVVAVALGVALLGEHLTAGAVLGLLLILAGSWLSTDGRLPPGPAGLWARRSARAVQS